MSRAGGGAAFCGAENSIGDGVLESTERRPVNCVDNQGNSGAMGSETAEDACFAAVGMDEGGAVRAK